MYACKLLELQMLVGWRRLRCGLFHISEELAAQLAEHCSAGCIDVKLEGKYTNSYLGWGANISCIERAREKYHFVPAKRTGMHALTWDSYRKLLYNAKLIENLG